jgi:Caspase domain
MRRLPRWFLMGLLVLPACLALVLAQEPERRGRKYALLIGVQQYDGTDLKDLKFCENDVSQLAEVLRGEGYAYNRVVLLTQREATEKKRNTLLPIADNIRDHLKGILKDLRPEDTVLIAFAGHGVQLKKDGRMYFCPALCNLDKPETLLSLDDLYAELKACKANEKILLVDACRNDPLDGTRGVDDRLGSVTRPLIPDPPGGTVAMFSCSKGQMAREDVKNSHGYLFKFVIEGLKGNKKVVNERTGEVSWLQLAAFVSEEVKDAVKEDHGPRAEQVPEIKGEVRGLVLGRVTRPKEFTPDDFKEITKGLPEAKVIELLGKPKRSFVLKPPQGEKNHFYESRGEYYHVTINHDGKVKDARRYANGNEYALDLIREEGEERLNKK